MRRREFLSVLAAGAGGSALRCAVVRSSVEGHLQSIDQRGDLAVLFMSLGARSATGAIFVGRLVLPDCCTHRPCISPDANFVAWIPDSAGPNPGAPPQPVAMIAESLQRRRKITYKGAGAGLDVAVSSGGSRLTVVSRANATSKQLVGVYDCESGELESDLQTVFERLDIERLSMSGAGDRLAAGGTAAGSEDGFKLVEVPSGAVLFAGQGRFPSISPDGSNLAFVDAGHRLVVRNLVQGRNAAFLENFRVQGVGSWSPDSKLLLVGCRQSTFSTNSGNALLVVDIARNESVKIRDLGVDDYGSRCLWIKRRFLSPA